MKKILIGKEVSGYILDLAKKNKWKIVFGDVMEMRNLFIVLKSHGLVTKEVLIRFDVSIRKLTKPYVDMIKEAKQNIIIVTDDIKKVPIPLRRICEVEKLEVKKEDSVMDVMGKLGKNLTFEEIKKIPLGQLIKYVNVNWQKFEGREFAFDLLLEINKRLYKVGDDYLYLYLLWGFPKQTRRTFFRYPTPYKYATKESIIGKVAKHYGYSKLEAGKMWWLVRRIMNNEMADKYRLSNEERKLLGIKKQKFKTVKGVKVREMLKSKSLLEI